MKHLIGEIILRICNCVGEVNQLEWKVRLPLPFDSFLNRHRKCLVRLKLEEPVEQISSIPYLVLADLEVVCDFLLSGTVRLRVTHSFGRFPPV